MSGEKDKKEGRDFYTLLGLERNEEASDKFKEISTAYAILSDPSKKHMYDLKGEDEALKHFPTVNIEEMGTLGRVIGGLVTQAGVPLPTEITPKVLSLAKYLTNGETNIQGIDIPQVITVEYGKEVAAKLPRQSANNGNDKFKVIFFDKDGQVSMIQESRKLKKHSEANILLLPFPHYQLNEQDIFSRMSEDIPSVFMALDLFNKDTKSLIPGKHLFCVYQDNWLFQGNFTMKCLEGLSQGTEFEQEIRRVEDQMVTKKKEMEEFQPEYVKVMKKAGEVTEKVKNFTTETNELMAKREKNIMNILQSVKTNMEIIKLKKNTSLFDNIPKFWG
ncbi:unnamed protein product [Lepeophtheirus salmonis]|uniref:(salmon louse) hypothetical protein n=1 Tax=Lepeophtheirus salmonis TaxID=72036 RepID=A0A7R8HAW6_LEPSM|nr:unnamed protein product [Lepeophtheirus salmonis]CAF2972628.1 unnamed protein product [Lepeophtheirus salmonis]